jgi:hypothetical protein
LDRWSQTDFLKSDNFTLNYHFRPYNYNVSSTQKRLVEHSSYLDRTLQRKNNNGTLPVSVFANTNVLMSSHEKMQHLSSEGGHFAEKHFVKKIVLKVTLPKISFGMIPFKDQVKSLN